MRSIVLAVVLAAGCDMPIPKQIVTWPLTGTLDTAKGPLALVPGSFLQLDDVRQERAHEWRNRQGITHDNSLDDLAAAPLQTAELPGGGLFGLTVNATNGNSGIACSRNVPSTASRWANVGTACSQVTPSQWSRRAVATDVFQVYSTTFAVGNSLRFVAWKPGTAAIGQSEIRFLVTSDTDGKTVLGPGDIGATTGTNPKVVYDATSQLFVLFWIDGTNVNAAKWSATTGAFVSGPTTLKNNAAAGSYLDVLKYTTNNITVVYNQTGGNAHQLEVAPTTFALVTDVDLGVSAGNALSLLPDPDLSGVRFVALITAAGVVHVLRCTAAGAVTTDDTVEAGVIIQTRIIGVAYQSGASWMVVYKGLDGGFQALRAAKKYSGVVGAALTLVGAHTSSPYELDSNAWREPGTDVMRYISGIHVGGDFVAVGDFQASYFEMALEYDNSGSTIGNRYTEPQARLIPLNAGPILPAPNAPVQVVRKSANNYALALVRIAQPIVSGGVVQNLYAIDTWDQTILSPSSTFANNGRPNVGRGVTGSQAGYIPAGMLMQSARAALIHGHGASALPFRPTTTIAAFVGGLTATQAYQYVVTDNLHDDAGNIWRSSQSVASAPITPTAGNTQVNVVVRLSTYENALRMRTVKIWRTLGNGAVAQAQLVHQRTIQCDTTNATFTFADTVPDTTLDDSNFLPLGLPASITPAFNHVAFFDGRMWGAERDFPSRLRFTQPIQGGISPEFPGEFFKDVEDEQGDITGLAALDDKLIVLKGAAIYFVGAGGPNLDGSGQQYTVTRVSSEVGAEVGTPTMSTGAHAWFFSHGVYRINRSLQIEFIGEPIGRYFNHPMLQTPEWPLSLTYNQRRDEIRLLTTNYRFVFDIVHGCWIRDTGAPEGAYFTQQLTGIGDMFFMSSGQVWWDYDAESLTSDEDASGGIQGAIRSPWMRSAPEGYIRLYKTRTTWAREPALATASWPSTTLYFNEDDALFQTVTPGGISGSSKQTVEARTARQKLSAFSIKLTLPAGDMRWRLNQWSVLLGVKKSMHFDSRARLGRLDTSTPPADMWLWLKADAGVTKDEFNFVEAWEDQTGNDHGPTQGAIGGILWEDAQFDGLPAVRFQANGLENIVDNIPLGARTIMCVAQPDGPEGGSLITFRRGPAAKDWVMYSWLFAGTQYLWSDGTTNIAATTPVDYSSDPHLYEHAQTASHALTVDVDAAVIPKGAGSTTDEDSDAGYTLGGRAIGSYLQGWDGRIAEIMIWDRALTAEETALARAYVVGRYPSITLA